MNKRKDYHHEYYLKHREKHLKQTKDWADNNQEYLKQYHKERYQRIKHKIKFRNAITTKLWKKRNPWASCYYGIKKRCYNKTRPNYHRYGGRGIKCIITIKEVKQLYIIYGAEYMKRPSIHRIDNDGHYTLKNCMFIECSAHSKYHNTKKEDSK